MYRITFSALFCLFVYNLNAQWEWVNPQPQGNEIIDMCMTPSGHIIAVGESKTIILSEDHGTSWQVINSGNDPRTHFHSVFFTDDNHGWIPYSKYYQENLYNNYLLKTSDGGKNWDTSYCALDQRLICVFFTNPLKGWIVGDGGKMMRTNDGGGTWQLMYSGSNKNLKSVCFADENIGVAVGEKGTILFTEKGGTKWEKIDVEMNTDLNRVFCLDRHCFYIVGQDGLVLFSEDGYNWRKRTEPAHRHLYDVHFNSVDSGWVCGYSKEVYFTDDGGLSWKPQWAGGSGDYPDYFTLCSDGHNELWVSGRYGNIIKTIDGGSHWTHLNPGLRSYLNKIRFISETTGWLIDNKKTIYKSSDGGYSWISTVTANTYLTALFCLDSLHIYACGHQLILSTFDGGLNWSTYYIPTENAYLEDIFFSDSQHGWTITETDSIYMTDDGGTLWNAVALPLYAYNNRSLFFVDQYNGWLAGDCIYHTMDGGITWDLQLQGGLSPNDLYFSDPLTGWCIIHDGYVYYTNDGGENWMVQLSNAYYIYEVAFADDLNGWIVGYEGIMWHTSDGGINWTKSYLPTMNAYCSITATEQGHIWVCGNSGAILRYNSDNKPSQDFSENIPPGAEIDMAQQVIEISLIPENNENEISALTLLKVYNLQGMIVCQENYQGNIDMNNRSLLSGLKLRTGIYIIQFIKGSLVETRKIVVF